MRTPAVHRDREEDWSRKQVFDIGTSSPKRTSSEMAFHEPGEIVILEVPEFGPDGGGNWTGEELFGIGANAFQPDTGKRDYFGWLF